MNHAKLALCGLAVMAWYVCAAWTQERTSGRSQTQPGERENRGRGEAREGQGRSETPTLRGDQAQLAEAAGLSAEQRKKMAELMEARQKAIQDVMTQYQEQISAVLTPEQRAKWNESLLLGVVQRNLARVNLTEDQLTKVKALVAEQAKGMTMMVSLDERATGEALRKLLVTIQGEVLTDEQKAAFQAGAGRRPAQTQEAPKDTERRPAGSGGRERQPATQGSGGERQPAALGGDR